MDIEQRAEMLTKAYIRSYNFALEEVKNPNLAAQIAAGVTMVIDLNLSKQQAISPLELLFAQMATAVKEQAGKGESEADDHGRTENAID